MSVSIPKIILPKQPRNDIYNHYNDTFRELVKLWNRNGLCQIELSDNPHVWWNQIGDVLLYDRPTLDFLPSNLQYKIGLFGNPELPDNAKKNTHWIFWARRPELLEIKKIKQLDYQERKVESIFLGKVENQVQLYHRTQKSWRDVIKLFEMPINGEYKYSQTEYLDLVSQSKFGLCLRGYGPKCNREIELMAFGTVPIVTPGVDTEGYFEPLIRNTHYLYAETPSDIPKIIAQCTPEEWKTISDNCRDWFQRNCSIKGSFNVTQNIVESMI